MSSLNFILSISFDSVFWVIHYPWNKLGVELCSNVVFISALHLFGGGDYSSRYSKLLLICDRLVDLLCENHFAKRNEGLTVV